MNRLRPRTTVLGGAALGLIAGAAVFGAVSSSSATTPESFTQGATASVDIAAPAAAAEAPTTALVPGATHESEHSTGPSESGDHATEVEAGDAAEAATEAAEAANEAAKEAADHANEAAKEAADHANEAAKEAADHANEAAKEAADHARDAAEGAGQAPSVEPSGNDSPDTSGG